MKEQVGQIAIAFAILVAALVYGVTHRYSYHPTTQYDNGAVFDHWSFKDRR